MSCTLSCLQNVALASFYKPILSRDINPLTEIVTTVGATEAIYNTIRAFINPGDEVILMQPFYDAYPASVRLSGGIPVHVTLRSATATPTKANDFQLDMSELRRKITPNTKMIVVNNPHNPLGKVFARDELLEIASIAKEFNLLVLADEVYESLVYDDLPFIKFASLPEMWERTISLGSAGKTFGVTGWKVGWCLGPPELIRPVSLLHQWTSFSVSTPLQEATAIALERAESENYFKETTALYSSLRDKLYNVLQKSGLNPILPSGGYFIMGNTKSVHPASEYNHSRRDVNVCKYLTAAAGVCSIPTSSFYDTADSKAIEEAGYWARFAFCKDAALIQEAGRRLLKWREESGMPIDE